MVSNGIGDRNFFKGMWEPEKYEWKHDETVNLIKIISDEIPEVESAITTGFGANSPNITEGHSAEEFPPSIKISPKGNPLCYIRVNTLGGGPPGKYIGPESKFFILEKKYNLDLLKNAKTWYYFVCRNGHFVIDIESIKLYLESEEYKKLYKDNPALTDEQKDATEKMIKVPYKSSHPVVFMMSWIKNKVRQG
jgi:hypothetical protein